MSDTTDRMRRYESNQDSGDSNPSDNATNDPQPASTSPALDTNNDQGGNNDTDTDPIPMATPQSPVQTEDSPEVKEDNSPEIRSNKGNDREYREV